MPADQPDTGQLAATNSSSSNNIDSSSRSSSSSVAGHNATEASPNDALAQTDSSRSNFQLMQPFSVTGIAQDDLKVQHRLRVLMLHMSVCLAAPAGALIMHNKANQLACMSGAVGHIHVHSIPSALHTLCEFVLLLFVQTIARCI